MARKFGGEFILLNLAVLRVICQYFIRKNFPVGCHHYCVIIASICTIGLQLAGIEFTIDSCVRGQHVSKEFWTLEVGEEFACREEGNPNDVYVVAVKIEAGIVVGHLPRKIFTACSLFLHQGYHLKIAHSPVKFPAFSISHFAMNSIMVKTFSTAKVDSTKCHNFSNPPKYLPAKISSHTVSRYFSNYTVIVSNGWTDEEEYRHEHLDLLKPLAGAYYTIYHEINYV